MKLLSKTVKNYVLYSAILLAVSVPLFYLVIRQYFIRQLDKEIYEHRKDFIEQSAAIENENDLKFFYRVNKEFSISESKNPNAPDSLFVSDQYDSSSHKKIPFRVLRSVVQVYGKPYDLTIKESLLTNEEIVITIVITQTITIIVLFVGLILINRKQSKTLWKPFYDTLLQLKKYQLDKKTSLPLTDSDVTEFNDLKEAVTQLINKNYEVYLSQKEFTENAAHELQTPMAIFRSKLDLLMQDENLSKTQAEIIHELHEASSRLSRLKRNLLLMTKIDNHQFADSESINLSEVIQHIIDQYSDQVQYKNLKIDTKLDSQFRIQSNLTLIEILLQNLITNAFKYASQEGSIEIELRNSIFRISNTGESLINPEKIFSRFYRDARQTTGSGLGLSIAKKIVDVLGYTIEYQYQNNRHHFSVYFLKK